MPVTLFQSVDSSREAPPSVPAPHPSGHTRTTVKQLATKRKAQRADLNPHTMVRARARALTRAAQTDGYALPPALTLDQQIRMASELVTQFHQEAKGTAAGGATLTANGRKQAAVSFAVCLDKLLVLQGRPSQIIGHQEADEHRAAAWALARKLARVDERRA